MQSTPDSPINKSGFVDSNRTSIGQFVQKNESSSINLFGQLAWPDMQCARVIVLRHRAVRLILGRFYLVSSVYQKRLENSTGPGQNESFYTNPNRVLAF
jgi:hypothetical protein